MNIIKYPIKIFIRKYDDMIYFSQLDIFHTLEKALRRTDLPIYFTMGFNPHPKISFHNALKLGQEGKIEVTLYFSEETSKLRLKDSLGQQLPDGLTIVD